MLDNYVCKVDKERVQEPNEVDIRSCETNKILKAQKEFYCSSSKFFLELKIMVRCGGVAVWRFGTNRILL